MSNRLSRFLLLLAPALCLPLPLSATAVQRQPPAPLAPLAPEAAAAPDAVGSAGETLDVQIRIVPFCAVDAGGKPIFDLRQDEVALRLGGRPVALDTLDRTGGAAEANVAGQERRGAPAAAGPGRTVVFFFDTAFTGAAAVLNSRLVAEKLLSQVPEGQQLELWVHSAARGLEQPVPPVRSDAVGKKRVLAALSKLVAEAGRLTTNNAEPLQLEANSGARVNHGAPTSQEMGNISMVQGTARSEYDGIARELAGALEFMAAELRHQRGPKLLLVFFRGIDSDLYFNGDIGAGPGSTFTVVDGRRYDPLMLQFTAPLKAIADSGAMTVFVDAAGSDDVGNDAEGVIRNMAQTASAYYAGGADVKDVEERIAATTAACYEAGFYIRERSTQAREAVEVTVQRPGAVVWAPAALRVRDTWETLTATERRMLVLDLVAGGSQAQKGPFQLATEELGGTVLSRPEGRGGRRLNYQAAWPADAAGKELDLYNVALARPARGEKTPKVLKFDLTKRVAAGGAQPLEVDLGKSDSLIWAIVAVEPATGRAWYRRLQLAGPEAPGAR